MNTYHLLTDPMADALETSERPDLIARTMCEPVCDLRAIEVVIATNTVTFHHSNERLRQDIEVEFDLGYVAEAVYEGYLA